MTASALRAVMLTLRFALELTALGALAAYGGRWFASPVARVATAVSLPLVAAVAWGMFVAPKASHTVALPARLAVEALVLGGAAAALALASHQRLAAGFLAAAIVNSAFLHVSHVDRDMRHSANRAAPAAAAATSEPR